MLTIARREMLVWLPLALVSFIVANTLIGGWPHGLIPDLSHPFVYSGDGLAAAWWVDKVVNGTWIFHSDRSGYPFGSDVLDYPVSDAGSFILLKALGTLTGSTWAAENLYILSGFPATFIAAYFAMRAMRIGAAFSAAGSMLFTLLPFHFVRLEAFQHVFLSWYAVVPIFFLAAWRLYTRRTDRMRRSSWSIATRPVYFVALASFGLYYAIFGILILMVGGIAGWLRKRSPSTLAVTAGSVLLVCTGIALNIAPNLAYIATHGANPQVARRALNESEVYGLKLVQMLLPRADHRISAFGEVTRRYDSLAPLVNENASATLGVVGSAGLLLVGAVAFVRIIGRDIDERLAFLALVVLTACAIATTGGLSAVFATLVSPAVRGWNRMSVFIAFGALSTSMIALEHLIARLAPRQRGIPTAWVTAALLTILGGLDQTAPVCEARKRAMLRDFERDRDFVAAIEKALPPSAAIYQLPYMPFPEVPAQQKLGAYDLIVGAIQSNSLRWSYGAIKGRQGDSFYRALATQSVAAQLAVLRRLRFSGVYIDRRGYEDGGRAVEHQLRQILGVGPTSIRSDGNVAFYTLAPTSSGLDNGLSASTIMALAGFSADRFGTRYAATLQQGIDFRKQGLPAFIRQLGGLSGVESWGRWSDANLSREIVFKFSDSLPRSFILAIRGQAFGPNISKPILVRIGDERRTITLSGTIQEARTRFQLGDSEDTIEIVPPVPVSPAALHAGDDQRQLGIGLERMWFELPAK